jgi:hypothetical protein
MPIINSFFMLWRIAYPASRIDWLLDTFGLRERVRELLASGFFGAAVIFLQYLRSAPPTEMVIFGLLSFGALFYFLRQLGEYTDFRSLRKNLKSLNADAVVTARFFTIRRVVGNVASIIALLMIPAILGIVQNSEGRVQKRNAESRPNKVHDSTNYDKKDQEKNFDSAASWSVTFQFSGVYSAMIPGSLGEPFYMALHGAEFSNLSTTQRRILDVKINVPTTDSEVKTLVLNTATAEFQSYRKRLIDSGISVDAEAMGRRNAILKNPIILDPSQFLEGTVELDIEDREISEKFIKKTNDSPLGWLKMQDAMICVTDRRSDITKCIKLGKRYDALSDTILKAIQP